MPSRDPTIAAKDAWQLYKLDTGCFPEWGNTRGSSYAPIS